MIFQGIVIIVWWLEDCAIDFYTDTFDWKKIQDFVKQVNFNIDKHATFAQA